MAYDDYLTSAEYDSADPSFSYFQDDPPSEDEPANAYATLPSMPHGAATAAMMTPKVPPHFNGRTGWFAYEELIDEGYDENIQNIMFMHWTYDDLIRNGTKSNIERFILESSPIEHDDGFVEINENVPLYKNALDIKPYIDYVKSEEYGHVEKKVVIDKMNEVKKLLGFTDVQQGGRVQQYGGMWQRGGFFMTCS